MAIVQVDLKHIGGYVNVLKVHEILICETITEKVLEVAVPHQLTPRAENILEDQIVQGEGVYFESHVQCLVIAVEAELDPAAPVHWDILSVARLVEPDVADLRPLQTPPYFDLNAVSLQFLVVQRAYQRVLQGNTERPEPAVL